MDARKKKRIERMAEAILVQQESWRVGFDIYKLIADIGIQVEFKDLGPNIYGASKVDQSRIILVNSTNHSNRQRFSAAHELGHMYLHQETALNYSDRLLYRSDKSSEGSDWREIEANYFAACLLMPQQLVEHEIARIGVNLDENSIEELARAFAVSPIAMSIRLSALGYL